MLLYVLFSIINEGFCFGQETVGNGERWSTAKAFLRPAMIRPNLHVSTNAYVTKVLVLKNNFKIFSHQIIKHQ